jgi:hypothetical protein
LGTIFSIEYSLLILVIAKSTAPLSFSYSNYVRWALHPGCVLLAISSLKTYPGVPSAKPLIIVRNIRR